MRLPIPVKSATALLLASAFSAPAAPAPGVTAATPPVPIAVTQTSPMKTAPQPIMRNPNAPRPVVRKPRPDQNGSGPPPEHYTALAFIVKTGGDDLRLDSGAWVNLAFQDQSSVHCVLKQELQDGWDNGSTHDQDIPVCVLPSPMTLDQIKAAKIELAYHTDDRDFETPDNWNVDRVRIEALNATDHSQTCVIDEFGEPLVRLKDLSTAPESNAGWPNGTFDLGHQPSTC